MQKPYLITSALPYCNNTPHLGNLVGSTLSADVYARFKRLQGKKVLYLCGTDEYGTTTQMTALKEKVTCKELCDKYHKLHKDVYDWFNISFDIFGRTSTDTQTKLTQEIFKELHKKGFIEQKETEQLYCITCKLFLADRYLIGTCYHKECNEKKSVTSGDQCDTCGNLIEIEKLQDAKCALCNNSAIYNKTTHMYLKLNEIQEQLEDHYSNNKTILSPIALSITKTLLKDKLPSRCITRDLEWGTPVPEEFGLKNKVFYVWFDAPIGYYSILQHGLENKDDYKEWLDGEIVQFMAKDNVIFHTIMFPATLLASASYSCATQICAIDYLMYENTKFSKSKNIGIFGDQVKEMSEKLNIDEDYWRFYLMKIRPETKDSNFTWGDFAACVKSDLCFKIGNYINRCVSLSEKYFPDVTFIFNDKTINDDLNTKLTEYISSFDKFHIKNALNISIDIAEYGNLYLQNQQPWAEIKKSKENTQVILGNSIYICYFMLKLLTPFIPRKAESLLRNIVCEYDIFNNDSTNKDIQLQIIPIGYKIPFIQIE